MLLVFNLLPITIYNLILKVKYIVLNDFTAVCRSLFLLIKKVTIPEFELSFQSKNNIIIHY